MVPDGNRIQSSYTHRHWGHLTMYRVSPVSGVCMSMLCNFYTAKKIVANYVENVHTYLVNLFVESFKQECPEYTQVL